MTTTPRPDTNQNLKTFEKRVWLAVILIIGIVLMTRFFTVKEMGRYYAVDTGSGLEAATAVDKEAGVAFVDVDRSIGIWISALMTIGIFSFLYKDNPYYKVCEALFIGISAAYWMVLSFWTTIIPNLFGKLFPTWTQSWAIPGLPTAHEHDWWLYFVPLILGIMLLMRLFPKYGWMARWPLAFIIGTTAGLRLIGFLEADFWGQIINTINSFPSYASMSEAVNEGNYSELFKLSNAIIVVVSILACLVYFFFSIEHKGAVAKVARLGIFVLMVTFGAGFGFTVMGRIALLAIRLEFLIYDWLALDIVGG